MATHQSGPTVHDADFVIFVAKDKSGKPQEVHAPRADMILASPVFKKMLSEEWNYNGGKVVVNSLKFETLRLVVEFVQNFDIVTEVDFLDLLKLIKMADFFLLKPLVKLCSTRLVLQMDVINFWTLLDIALKYDTLSGMSETCGKFLASKTMECLSHPSFLLASFESMVFLLNLDTLSLQSDCQLVLFCWKWAELQQLPLKVMMDLLPHLKLEKSLEAGIGNLFSIHQSGLDFVSKCLNLILTSPPFIGSKGARILTSTTYTRVNLKDIENAQIILLNPVSKCEYTYKERVSCKVFIKPSQNLVLFGVQLPLIFDPKTSWWKYDHLGHKFSFVSQPARECKYKLKLWNITSELILADVEGVIRMAFSNGTDKEDTHEENAIILDRAPLLKGGERAVLTIDLEIGKHARLPAYTEYSPKTNHLEFTVDSHPLSTLGRPKKLPSFITGLAIHKISLKTV